MLALASGMMLIDWQPLWDDIGTGTLLLSHVSRGYIGHEKSCQSPAWL